MAHTLSRQKKERVALKTGKRCFYCGADLIEGKFTVDHVIPKSKGGHKSHLSNLVPACRSCNEAKKDMDLEDFRHTLDRKTFYGERSNVSKNPT